MSLHIGNLSTRTRRDELERVFCRFGHCNVRLKGEGYGFVVYDFPPDAEKALRALQGRNICGEQLTLTWSKKQPKSFQRFARSGRNYEMQRGRNSDMAGFARRKMNLNGWRNYKISNDARNNSVDMPSGEREYHHDDFKDYDGEEKDFRQDFLDDGAGAHHNFEDNGRWGESIHDSSIDNGNENAVEFDQYEPYHGYDRKHENENHNLGYSGGSPAENSRKNVGRARIGEEASNRPRDPAYGQTCYRCGDSGHKMRNCPNKDSSHRKYNKWDDGEDGKINWKRRSEDDPKKFGSGSQVKLQSGGDTSFPKHQKNESWLPDSRHYQTRESKFSPAAKAIEQSQGNEYEGRKRGRKGIGSPKRSQGKKARRSITPSLQSDRIASCLNSISQSSKSLQRSHTRSRSRSASSRAHFSSPDLRSSRSHYSMGRSPNSKRSSTPSSLSVSLGQPLQSATNEIHLNSKGSTLDVAAPESLDKLVGQGQQSDRNLELENDKSKDTSDVVGNDASYANIVDDNNENGTLFGMSPKGTNFTKALPDKDTLDAENLSSERKQTEGFQRPGPLVMDNIPPGVEKPASEPHANVLATFF
ncbi:serine/arginine-rich splicing factor 6-like [Neltuma alba]|uniref:serine/arginine-rich splicing factor 6-like n=1 Tax=Neltuma alba TaxID=207710 RepID=UPI0010A39021|nr:serine/arginine-rich splicing factor 6-like [Prosopis alba]